MGARKGFIQTTRVCPVHGIGLHTLTGDVVRAPQWRADCCGHVSVRLPLFAQGYEAPVRRTAPGVMITGGE